MTQQSGQEQRAFLAIILAMGVLLVWNFLFPPGKPPVEQPGDQPTEQHVTELESSPTSESGQASGPAAGVDTAGDAGRILGLSTGSTELSSTAPVERRRVEVSTPDLALSFDSRGARVTAATLPEFEGPEDGPVQVLPPDGPGALGTVIMHGDRTLPLDGFDFALVSDEHSPAGRRLVFQLDLDQASIRKTFTVPDSGHVLQVEQEILNDRLGVQAWGVSWASGMQVTEEIHGNSRGPYFGAVVFAEGEVQRKTPNQATKGPIEFPGACRYLGIENKYFLGAIVPRGDAQGPVRLWRVTPTDEQHASLAGEILVDRSSALASDHAAYDVYLGPLDYGKLKALNLGIEGAVDLGARWIRPLSRVILSLITGLHKVIPNYGVVIILFALFMNALFFPLTWKSTKSMRDMSALKPRLDALREKYADEPQKLSEATMKLYKEAGVNPLAGCLPLFIQMPIFFALYAVLMRTIELRQEPFILWIRDLSQPDVIFTLPFALPLIGTGICLLPIIMGVTSYFQSKQTMVDPNQRAMLVMMPVMMTFIFFTMPSGLVLYWLTSNVFQIVSKNFMKPSAVAEAIAEAPLEVAPKKGGGAKRRAKAAARG
ncbi:MAG: membrane protein insertase YidC [bacterium]